MYSIGLRTECCYCLPIKKAYLLADANREELLYTSCDAGQRLQVPLSAPDKINSVIVVELK